MFWAIAAGAVDTRGFRFEQVLQDIQSLNEWALEGRLEVTAISLHAYPFVQDRYALLPHGASIGSGYGPILVAREPLAFEQLGSAEIVVPGRMTTAFLTLRLALGDFAHRELPFDHILDEVSSGRADVGPGDPRGPAHLRGRRACTRCSTSASGGCSRPGLPLPLGVNVARRDLGDRLPDLSAVLLESIQAGLANRREAMRYAMRFGRGIDVTTADRFVEMYVNELTCDYGDEGRKAVAELLGRGDAIGAFPEPVRLDYVFLDAAGDARELRALRCAVPHVRRLSSAATSARSALPARRTSTASARTAAASSCARPRRARERATAIRRNDRADSTKMSASWRRSPARRVGQDVCRSLEDDGVLQRGGGHLPASRQELEAVGQPCRRAGRELDAFLLDLSCEACEALQLRHESMLIAVDGRSRGQLLDDDVEVRRELVAHLRIDRDELQHCSSAPRTPRRTAPTPALSNHVLHPPPCRTRRRLIVRQDSGTAIEIPRIDLVRRLATGRALRLGSSAPSFPRRSQRAEAQRRRKLRRSDALPERTPRCT